MLDSRDIKTLHPVLQRAAKEFISRCKQKKIDVIITSTLRDNEYQTKLYNQGRTTPGEIITKAKAGQSMHNYGLAFDYAPLTNGIINWSDSNPLWSKCGAIGVAMGFVWGGSWQDSPHMEFTNGLTFKDLQNGKKVPENVKMKWELEADKMNEEISKTLAKILEKLEKLETTVSLLTEHAKTYNTLDEIPEWARPTIKDLVDKGILLGDGRGLALTMDVIKELVLHNRIMAQKTI